MANTAAPFGFRQWSGTGSAPTYEQVAIPILYSNSTAIYKGDPVSIDASSGCLQQATAGTAPLAGIFAGCKYNSVSRNGQEFWSAYWPGADAISGSPVGYLVNDPNSLWEVQVDGNGPVVQATVGANYQFAIGTGNTLSGQSGASLVGNSNNTTATLPFRLVSIVTFPPGTNGTDISTTYNLVIVQANNWLTRTATGIA